MNKYYNVHIYENIENEIFQIMRIMKLPESTTRELWTHQMWKLKVKESPKSANS